MCETRFAAILLSLEGASCKSLWQRHRSEREIYDEALKGRDSYVALSGLTHKIDG
jgi:hypothetical protein